MDSSARSNAERWFDATNRHATNGPFINDDPPFYLRDQPSGRNSDTGAVRSEGSLPSISPVMSPLAQRDTDETKAEDFRSVIDDLTIQNKRLKKKLKQYEKLHCSHLQEEKLFEVRVHGLPAHRKRELEDTLRNFASTIEEESQRKPACADEPNSIPTKLVASRHKPSSSSTSYTRPVDSAYASMNENQSGVAHPQLFHSRAQDKCMQAPQTGQQNVKSYLHGIPDVMLPSQVLPMTDRSKSKLVVKRLEQLFTGRGMASRQNQSSHQQQGGIPWTAPAQKVDLELGGQNYAPEGTREAHILPGNAELQEGSMEDVRVPAKRTQGSSEDPRTRNLCSGREINPRSLEQRPTRPFDLDPHRAQLPSDNINYLRHLGLTSSEDVPSDQIGGGDDWVYLNLLTSMAQLHTLNVTPEFTRKAIVNVSSKFELSQDETKVRWLGGSEGTRMSSDGEESEDLANWKSSERNSSATNSKAYTQYPRIGENIGLASTRPLSVSEMSAGPGIGAKRRPIHVGGPDVPDKFQYKPLFFQNVASDEDGDSDLATNSNATSDSVNLAATGVVSGSNGLRERKSRPRRRTRENGPIIFYNGARFCTDLSGDSNSANLAHVAYSRYTQQTIGCFDKASDSGDSDNSNDNADHDGDRFSRLMEMEVDSTKTTRSALDLEHLTSSISECLSNNSLQVPMEASGLGGVRPEDNFIVRVQVQHGGPRKRSSQKLPPSSTPGLRGRRVLHSIPRSSIDAFYESDIQRCHTLQDGVKSEIISAVKTTMTPSPLPPPSYACLPFSSSNSENEDENGDISSPSQKLHQPFVERSMDAVDPQPTPFIIDMSPDKTPESSYESTYFGSDDSSIDLLAHARMLDPETIAACERDFDNIAFEEQLSQKIEINDSDLDSMSVDGDESSGT